MKEWFTLDRNDWFVMAVSYPAVFLANYLILGSAYVNSMTVFVPVTLGSTGLYILSAWSDDIWMKYMRYRYKELSQVGRRLLYCLIGYVGLMILFVCQIFWLYDLFE